MDDQELSVRIASATNDLPYRIRYAKTEQYKIVRFEQLSSLDAPQLHGPGWSSAVFRDVWISLIEDEHTLKLVSADSDESEIFGIVRIGRILPHSGALRKSLLETAPENSNKSVSQVFSGIGRVLVARLAIESIRQGREGAVIVQARRGTEGFYHKMGFRASSTASRIYELRPLAAWELVRSVIRVS